MIFSRNRSTLLAEMAFLLKEQLEFLIQVPRLSYLNSSSIIIARNTQTVHWTKSSWQCVHFETNQSTTTTTQIPRRILLLSSKVLATASRYSSKCYFPMRQRNRSRQAQLLHVVALNCLSCYFTSDLKTRLAIIFVIFHQPEIRVWRWKEYITKHTTKNSNDLVSGS